jgi:hypothetical protein
VIVGGTIDGGAAVEGAAEGPEAEATATKPPGGV